MIVAQLTQPKDDPRGPAHCSPSIKLERTGRLFLGLLPSFWNSCIPVAVSQNCRTLSLTGGRQTFQQARTRHLLCLTNSMTVYKSACHMQNTEPGGRGAKIFKKLPVCQKEQSTCIEKSAIRQNGTGTKEITKGVGMGGIRKGFSQQVEMEKRGYSSPGTWPVVMHGHG